MTEDHVTRKRYRTQDAALKERFGCKVAKITLSGGFTCPNRDGTKGVGGCIYCSASGSGDFAGDPRFSIREQFDSIRAVLEKKWKNLKYIAYFQAGTGTYAPVETLRDKYEQALSLPDVVGLSIATRPDCLGDDILDLLSELAGRTDLVVELGLQSVHDETGERIHRCCTYADFLFAYRALCERGIPVCVHLINGLPGETRERMLESVRTVASLRPYAVKLHMLHVIRGTVCAAMYERGEFRCFTPEEYIALVCDELELLPPETVVERITGDGARKTLVAPTWSTDKFLVLNGVDREMERRGAYQGDRFSP